MSEEIKTQTCAFCGKEATNINVFIRGKNPEVYICDACIVSAQQAVDMTKKSVKVKEKKLNSDITPSKILDHLNQYVVGQDYAKKVLSVAVYNHYKFLQYWEQENPAVEVEKSNILMLGPTGAGKTYLIKQLAKIFNVPYAISDCTGLTEAGFVGNDVEQCVRQLLDNAKGNIDHAQRGIIYLDEFDKLSRKGENMSTTKDVGGEGVQQALLKIIEGSEVSVPPRGERKHPGKEYDIVDTSKILFIVGGSFEGIDKIIENRIQKDKTSLGFGGIVKSKNKDDFNNSISNVQVEDLKKFGMIPEVLGRLPILCPLEQLNEESLFKILTEPKNAVIKQYQALFNQDGVELFFEDDAVKEISKEAIRRKTGARALRGIIDRVLLPFMFDIPDHRDITKVTITKTCVVDGTKPIFDYLPEKMA